MAKRTLAPGWTADRLDELDQLRALLNEIAMLDNANNHLERTARCIRAAEKLTRTIRIPKLREDFVTFLQDLALDPASD